MSDLEKPPAASEFNPDQTSKEDEPSLGPNLTVIYGLIALALAVAIGFAWMIVRPFYLRR